MKKTWLNFGIDLAMFLSLVSIAAGGFIMKYVLPPGSGRGHGRGAGEALFGLGRHDWGGLHFELAVVFLVLLGTHVVLHWNWIVCRFRALLPGRKSQDPAGASPELGSDLPDRG